jgi:GNAT superfamily N-acetyltransferase
VKLPPTELGEIEAFRTVLAGAAGGHVREIGGAVCVAFEGTPGSAMINRALGLTAASDSELAEIDGFYRGLGVDYAVTVIPDADPELGQRLERRGFRRGYAWAKFLRDPAPAPAVETELRVEAADAGSAGAFADVFIRAYGTPEILRPLLERLPSLAGWHCFVAYDGDVPAATAATFVAGHVAWFGVAGTLPELRGRGAQNALLAARVEAARRAGCSVLVTETGAPVDGHPGPSYRNILRAGFEPVYVRENYLSSADADTSGTLA